MKTINKAADLQTLTRVEKIHLAEQMAQEYIANMLGGKEIYITCGDEDLGNMLYASFLAIQMEAKKACANVVNKAAATIANAKIFPPTGIKSLDDSFDRTKENFIKKHLGDKQQVLADSLAKPALKSYLHTAKKMEAYDKAQEQYTTAEKNLGRGKKLFEKEKTYQNLKAQYKANKDKAESDAAIQKAKLLTLEPSTAETPLPKPK